MDLPEPQEQFEQEPMEEQAEEQSASADTSHTYSSSDLEPAVPSETQIPTDLPPIEATVEALPGM